MNPFRVALRSRSRQLCWPDVSANARDSWALQYLQPASDAPRVALAAAWSAVLPGQAVPMIGEEVGYVEPCDDV